MPITLHRRLADADATEACGRALANALLRQRLPGLLVALRGDLGAGKTTLVRALLRGLGVRGRIKSPSYALVEPYPVELRLELNETLHKNVYHVDLYRFSSADEWLDAGLDEVFDGHGLCLLEWAEKAPALRPRIDLELALDVDEPGRALTLRACSSAGEALLRTLEPELSSG